MVMTVMATPPKLSRGEIREIRVRLQRSQSEFATLLGVSVQSYRPWDSGRRAVPADWLDKARALAAAHDPERIWALSELASTLGVHVRTLRDAARSGRLAVVYGTRASFGHPVPRATLAAGRAFMAQYYRQSYSRYAKKPAPPHLATVPSDWPTQLVRLRAKLGLSQQGLARRIGVAGKAVVYQWESRKRRPSLILWTRIQSLVAETPDARSAPLSFSSSLASVAQSD
jgi:DNA-binding transcriptional regulator YiaG